MSGAKGAGKEILAKIALNNIKRKTDYVPCDGACVGSGGPAQLFGMPAYVPPANAGVWLQRAVENSREHAAGKGNDRAQRVIKAASLAKSAADEAAAAMAAVPPNALAAGRAARVAADAAAVVAEEAEADGGDSVRGGRRGEGLERRQAAREAGAVGAVGLVWFLLSSGVLLATVYAPVL